MYLHFVWIYVLYALTYIVTSMGVTIDGVCIDDRIY
jgi:hypothetical protein